MREFERSGAGRCTASPVPLARTVRARRRRPAAAATARAFLARRGPGSRSWREEAVAGPVPLAGPQLPAGPESLAGPELLAELRRTVPTRREPERAPARAPRPGRRPRPERAPVPHRSGPGEGAGRRVAPLLSEPATGRGVGRDVWAARPPVRLTRRGRLVVLALVLLLGAFVGFLAASPGQAADPPRPAVTAVVQPGDTLWSFAERNLPRWRTIDAVAELKRLNHLEGSVIHPGQRLTLPVRR